MMDDLIKSLRAAQQIDGSGKTVAVSTRDCMAAADEIERLRKALRPFAEALSVYNGFSEHQLILLSEDNPKGRRLAHLSPCHFDAAQAALPSGVNGGEE